MHKHIPPQVGKGPSIIEMLGILVAIIGIVATIVEYQSNKQKRALANHLEYPVAPGFYADLLDFTGIPDSAEDHNIFTFSDEGAWHAYALSPSPSQFGFSGPKLYSVHGGRWLSDCLAELSFEGYDSSNATHYSQQSIPGSLHQIWQFPDLEIDMECFFLSKRTSAIQVRLRNKSDRPLRLKGGWKGHLWEGAKITGLDHNLVQIAHLESGSRIDLRFHVEENKGMSTRKLSPKSFSIQSPGGILIPPKRTRKMLMAHTVYFEGEGIAKQKLLAKDFFMRPAIARQDHRKRWAAYMKKALTTKTGLHKEENYRRIAVKCMQTLLGNWRSTAGELPGDGLFPSVQVPYFHGFWAWDSWKHIAALSSFAPEIAVKNIFTMYNLMDSEGMIPDVVFRDKKAEAPNWRNTKPPLGAWAVWTYYEQSQDASMLDLVWKNLLLAHNWWYSHRDHDGNGLCEYGSTDGSLTAAKWESGMDNAMRFMAAKMLKNGNRSWSMDQESADLNAYLYAEKQYLMKIARRIGKDSMANKLGEQAKELAEKMRDRMYEDQSKWYYDVKIQDSIHLKVLDCAGFIPFWAGLHTPHAKENFKRLAADPAFFGTKLPFPSLSPQNPMFDPENGYWNGPVWLDQAYFAIRGLTSQTNSPQALNYVRKLFDNAEGLAISGVPIYENYHPLSGAGLNAPFFSWSAACLLMLYKGI